MRLHPFFLPPVPLPLRAVFGLTVLCGIAAFPARAAAQEPPTAAAVLAHVRTAFDRINDYTVDVTAVANVPKMKVPTMSATVYYKKPDKMRYKSQGFAMLPRDAVAFNPRLFSDDRYDAVVQGEDVVNGVRCIKVKLLAKSDTLRLQRVMLSVDPAHWTIVKMATDPDRGGSAETLISYTLVDNTYLLPSRVDVRIAGLPAPSMKPFRQGGQSSDGGPSQATVTLTYSNYRVNTGLSDSIFREDKRK